MNHNKHTWANMAAFLEYPSLRRRAKSENSCGISWIMVARRATSPNLIDVWKAPTTVVPWALLSTKLATRFRVPRAWAFGMSSVNFSMVRKMKNEPIELSPLRTTWSFDAFSIDSGSRCKNTSARRLPAANANRHLNNNELTILLLLTWY